MPQCGAIKADGSRCKNLAAVGSEWCSSHDPAYAERRRRNASKAARSKSGGAETAELKRQVKTVIAAVGNGKLDKSDASVMLQGYNVLARFVELERKADLDDLAAEVAELKKHGIGRAS